MLIRKFSKLFAIQEPHCKAKSQNSLIIQLLVILFYIRPLSFFQSIYIQIFIGLEIIQFMAEFEPTITWTSVVF